MPPVCVGMQNAPSISNSGTIPSIPLHKLCSGMKSFPISIPAKLAPLLLSPRSPNPHTLRRHIEEGSDMLNDDEISVARNLLDHLDDADAGLESLHMQLKSSMGNSAHEMNDMKSVWRTRVHSKLNSEKVAWGVSSRRLSFLWEAARNSDSDVQESDVQESDEDEAEENRSSERASRLDDQLRNNSHQLESLAVAMRARDQAIATAQKAIEHAGTIEAQLSHLLFPAHPIGLSASQAPSEQAELWYLLAALRADNSSEVAGGVRQSSDKLWDRAGGEAARIAWDGVCKAKLAQSPPQESKKKCLPVIRGGGFKSAGAVSISKAAAFASLQEGENASPPRNEHARRLQQTVDASSEGAAEMERRLGWMGEEMVRMEVFTSMALMQARTLKTEKERAAGEARTMLEDKARAEGRLEEARQGLGEARDKCAAAEEERAAMATALEAVRRELRKEREKGERLTGKIENLERRASLSYV